MLAVSFVSDIVPRSAFGGRVQDYELAQLWKGSISCVEVLEDVGEKDRNDAGHG